MTHKERRELWTARISDYQRSGEHITAWCERNEIKASQLGYWLRKIQSEEVRKQAHHPQWMSLHVNETRSVNDSFLLLKVADATIEVRPGFEPSLLMDVIRMLKTLC